MRPVQTAKKTCELCQRNLPPEVVISHQLRTVKGSRNLAAEICMPCESIIHTAFSNNQLQEGVEGCDRIAGLASHPQLRILFSDVSAQLPTHTRRRAAFRAIRRFILAYFMNHDRR